MTLTENSLLPKLRLQRVPNHHFRRKFNIFLAMTWAKIPLIMHQNAISSAKKSTFSQTLPWWRGVLPPQSPHPIPRPIKPSGCAAASPPAKNFSDIYDTVLATVT